MPYEIRIAKTVVDTGGPGATRRRTVETPDGPVTLTFGSTPAYLDSLPAEIAGDTHLVARQVTEAEMLVAGGVVTELKPERVQEPATLTGGAESGPIKPPVAKPRGRPPGKRKKPLKKPLNAQDRVSPSGE